MAGPLMQLYNTDSPRALHSPDTNGDAKLHPSKDRIIVKIAIITKARTTSSATATIRTINIALLFIENYKISHVM